MSNFKKTIKKLLSVYETSSFLKLNKSKEISNDSKVLFVIIITCLFFLCTSYYFAFIDSPFNKRFEILRVLVSIFSGVFSIILIICTFLTYKFKNLKEIIIIFYDYIVRNPYNIFLKYLFSINKDKFQLEIINNYEEIKKWFEENDYSENLTILISELKFPKKYFNDYDLHIENIRRKLKSNYIKVENDKDYEFNFLSQNEIENMSKKQFTTNIKFFTQK